MHDGILTVLVTLLDSRGLDNIPARLDHIQLNEPVIPRIAVGDPVELLLMQAVDVADVSEPGVEDAQVGRGQGGFHAAAVVVAAHDDVLDAQVPHCIVDHRHHVEVDVWDQVGDVAVHEYLARVEPHDLVGRHAAVAAADVSASR